MRQQQAWEQLQAQRMYHEVRADFERRLAELPESVRRRLLDGDWMEPTKKAKP